MKPENWWYIRLLDSDDRGKRKRPENAWGGHSIPYEENEQVYTYEETQELDHDHFGIVGHQGDNFGLVVDIDAYKVDDFNIDDLKRPYDCAIVKSVAENRDRPGYHFYVRSENRVSLDPAVDWVDLQVLGNTHVVSPFHEGGHNYEMINNSIPISRTCERFSELFEYEGESLIHFDPDSKETDKRVRDDPREEGQGFEFSGEAPEELPLCAATLAQIRKDPDVQYSNELGDFGLNTHLGQVLIENGYSMEECLEVFEEYSPSYGYNEEKTRNHLKRLYRKHESGDLHPPYNALLPEVKIQKCDCEVHGDNRVSFVPCETGLWDLTPSSENPSEHNEELTIEEVRQRTTSVLTDAISQETDVLIEALPGMGKSYGAIKAASITEGKITILTGRGHKEMYAQYEEWCDKFDLCSQRLPVFTQECPSANGDHGEETKERVSDLYENGVTPSTIHARLDLPCTEGEGNCPYQDAWSDSSLDSADVLIGHYTHAYVLSAIRGRTVIIDEFDEGAFERVLEPWEVRFGINQYLDQESDLPHRDISEVKESFPGDFPTQLIPYDREGVAISREISLAFDGVNIYAGYALVTILCGEEQGDIQRASIDGYECVYNHESGRFTMLDPSDLLGFSNGVVCLDGTPVKKLWELNLGIRLDHHAVLEEQHEEYITQARSIEIIKTCPHINTVGVRGQNVDTERTHELIRSVKEANNTEPGIITHGGASRQLDLNEYLVYGNLLGSNDFERKHVGIVTHSCHYGDEFVKRWCGYAHKSYQREGRGTSLAYGWFGDKVLRLMRESQVLQGILRFGRDSLETRVYVDTAGLPDWLPVSDRGDFYHNNGRRQVLKALQQSNYPIKAKQVAESLSISKRQTQRLLQELHEDGEIEINRQRGQTVWWDTNGTKISLE